MQPEQLRQLREARGLTRDQLATELGDCTGSTVNKWERGMHAIPQWVEDKMLRQVPLTLPIEELHALLDRARTEGIAFPELLGRAIRDYLHNTKPAPIPGTTERELQTKAGKVKLIEPTPPAPPTETPTSNIHQLPMSHWQMTREEMLAKGLPLPPSMRVAEEPPASQPASQPGTA